MIQQQGKKLLDKYLHGETSGEEVMELHRWLNDADHVEELSKWMDDNWREAFQEEAENVESEEVLHNLKKQLGLMDRKSSLERNQEFSKEEKRSSFSWLQLVAAVVLPIFFFGLGHYWHQFAKKEEKVAYLQTIVPKGQKAQLVLGDGTKVWLNSESQISYPSFFTNEKREVVLKGEAFFKVKRDEESPFYVKTGSMNVKVLGTEFNVSSYEEEKVVETTLVSGSVQLQFVGKDRHAGRVLTLSPNQKVSYDLKESQIRMQVVDPDAYTAWKEGKLIFRSVDFETLARKLERWYDVKIHFQDEELKTYRYTGTFDRETVEQAVEALRLTSPFSYVMDKRNIYISKVKNKKK